MTTGAPLPLDQLRELPLDGIRIVEFVHMVMGPACGLVLADLGADVIKVEPAPDGDNTRRLTGSGAGFFVTFNRNKRSLAVDLKDERGMQLVRRLVATADVVTENFRPGAMDKLGLGYAALSADNPRLIYCSLKGFLPGPYEKRVALDEVVQMMGGLAYMTGLPGKPMRVGSSVNDIMGGAFGAIGILAALQERNRTGRGRYIQAGLFENTLLLVAQHMAQLAATGEEPKPMGERDVAWPVYDLFETADGEQVFLGVVTDTQWKSFCAAFCLTALAEDPTLETQAERKAARPRVLPLIAQVIKRYPTRDLIAQFDELGLPYAPITKPAHLFDDPHLNAAGGLVPITMPDGRRTKLPALPISLDGVRPGLRGDPPRTGQHSADVARELGFSEPEIKVLCQAGVLRG